MGLKRSLGTIGIITLAGLLVMTGFIGSSWAEEPAMSEATENCLACHVDATPGIVADWEKSRHAKASYAMGAKKPEGSRRVTSKAPEGELATVAVGCAECHTLNPDSHADTFDHEEERVHVVVSPADCATCHSRQVEEYSHNKMGNAHNILVNNPVYVSMMDSINGVSTYKDGKLTTAKADDLTNADSCLSCHGTKVEVKGVETKETDFGALEFPILSGWPSQGVGRINPDMTSGSCTSCHPRHSFDMGTARQPETCSQCHKGPDAPAYNIYAVSKHGNIQASQDKEWDYTQKPWVVGRDFNAPTCATCHVSGLEDTNGIEIVKSTHQMNDRLPWRLFGIIYSHPQPKKADTTIIRNKEGLPLPTSFDGEWAREYLIDEETRNERTQTMQSVCMACHSSQWVNGHWERMEHTLKTTDAMVKASTDIMIEAWDQGYAKGLAQDQSPWDESIEKKWMLQWLFYANSTRKAAAMAGADYGVFAGGRWDMAKNLADMAHWMDMRKMSKQGGQ